MKLKFRAEKKDIKIFIIFCIVLLYLVAIALCNIVSFLGENELSGFNPLPAFSKEYFAPTMVFYTLALIFTITSVKDHFFERESGIGIKVGKKEKGGYARWATEDEMKKELKKVNPRDDEIPYGGIPIINNKKGMWIDNSEYHNLIIGSTGAGKTQVVVNPLVKILAKAGESMIITDPKGEIYEENANMLREKGYNVVLLNFRNPQEGSGWNPLTLPYEYYRNGNQDKAIELVDDLAVNILYDENAQNQDPFWEKTSADYFAGLTLALFEDAKPEEINLNSISLMSTLGEEKIKGMPGGKTYITEYFNSKDPRSTAYVDASSTLMAPSDTKASILSVFKQKIKLFASRENMSEMLSHSDFDMKDIGRKKTAVFIVIQDEKKTYHSLVTIFIKQCYETLIDVAQESPNGKLAYRTNFILDEFANMPPLKDVTTMVTAARSRSMRFNFIIQNFAQLTQVYGKDNGETIKGNCGNIIYLISSELNALEEISKMCGEKKSKEKDKTASTPLVTVSDLQRLEKWHAIILRIRMMPFKTRLKPNFEMLNENAWGKVYEKATYPHREKKEVQMFDLKGKVEEIRKEKMEQMGANANPFGGGPFGGASPFGGSSPFGGGNPFAGPNIFGGTNPMNDTPNKPMPSTSTSTPSKATTPVAPNKPAGMDLQDVIRRIDEKIAALEEEEKQERLAIEKKKKEEQERQSKEQEKLKRLEEEQRKKEEEEEKKRQELKKQQEIELEKIRKENEERKKKEETEKRKREEAQRKKEEEEKKRHEEEQRKKKEEEKRQQERIKQEQERMRREQEEKLAIQKREQEEQERIKKEQAERIRREQEALRKKEEQSKLPTTPIIEDHVPESSPVVPTTSQSSVSSNYETQHSFEQATKEIEHEITEDEFFDDFFSDDDDDE